MCCFIFQRFRLHRGFGGGWGGSQLALGSTGDAVPGRRGRGAHPVGHGHGGPRARPGRGEPDETHFVYGGFEITCEEVSYYSVWYITS